MTLNFAHHKCNVKLNRVIELHYNNVIKLTSVTELISIGLANIRNVIDFKKFRGHDYLDIIKSIADQTFVTVN